MTRLALFVFLVLTSCSVLRAGKHGIEDALGHANSIPRQQAKQRAEFLTSFVGKHSSSMMDEFGPPDEFSGDPEIGGYATYFIPSYSGVTYKIVFAVAADDTITNVNWWPK